MKIINQARIDPSSFVDGAGQIAPAASTSQTPPPSDVVASAGDGAPLALSQLGEPEILGRSRTSIKRPPSTAHRLTADELKAIARPGSVGLKGRGTLRGELTISHGKAYLITAAKGSKSEVRFQLDVKAKDVKALVGERVAFKGMLEKKSPWFGKITGATRVQSTPSVKVGSYQALSGKIDNRTLFGPGGEAPPSGSYLVLDQPVRIDGKSVSELYLPYKDFAQGEAMRLNGRIDVQSYGGVETQPGSVYALSGLSNLTAGEPRFDGQMFFDALDKPLEVLHYNRPLIMDAPAKIFVLDQGADRAFIGAMGGFIPPHMNPFHGFTGSAKIRNPTVADRAAVKFDANGEPANASTGKKLTLVSEEMSGQPSETFASRWYLDTDRDALYRLDSGGFGALQNLMVQVVKLPNGSV